MIIILGDVWFVDRTWGTQIYFIFPQLPFQHRWLGGGDAVNNTQWVSPYPHIHIIFFSFSFYVFSSVFSFCSKNWNQFCGELRGKGHKEDIRLVCPTKCERLPNKRCMAAFLTMPTPTSFVIFRMKSWKIVSCSLSEFLKGLLTTAEACFLPFWYIYW